MASNRLREFRKDQGLALWGLAARSHVSASLLSAIEKWDYRPGPEVRRRIAAALGVEPSVIWPEFDPTDGAAA